MDFSWWIRIPSRHLVARQFNVQDPQVPIVTRTWENPWEKLGKSMGNHPKIWGKWENHGTFGGNMLEKVGKVGRICCKILEGWEENVETNPWFWLCKCIGKAKTKKMRNVSGRFEQFPLFTAMDLSEKQGSKKCHGSSESSPSSLPSTARSNQFRVFFPSDMGVSIDGGTPIYGWFISWTIPSRNGWFGGTPICGNLMKPSYPHLGWSNTPLALD